MSGIVRAPVKVIVEAAHHLEALLSGSKKNKLQTIRIITQ